MPSIDGEIAQEVLGVMLRQYDIYEQNPVLYVASLGLALSVGGPLVLAVGACGMCLCALIGFSLLGLAALEGSLLFLSVCVLCLVLCWATFVGTWLALFSYVAHAILSRAYSELEHATAATPLPSMGTAEEDDLDSEKRMSGRRVSFCPTVDNDSGLDVDVSAGGDASMVKTFAEKVKEMAPDSVDEMQESSAAA